MYEHVLSPITIGGVEIKNRVVRTAHATGHALGQMSDRLIAYHAARARGGVGLTIVEIMSVHPSSPGSLNAIDPTLPDGHKRLLAACEPYGMKIFQQLWHAGHGSQPLDGGAPWSASDIPNPLSSSVPRAMTRTQIDEIVGAYARAARMCREAGLHGVEVHGAHGYLIQQFLSANTNKREDDYGGSLENRMRFLLEVMRAAHAEARDGFAVGIRLATDLVGGGVGVADNTAVVEALQAEGLADFVDISLGNYQTFAKMIGGMHEPTGYELETAAPVSAHVKVPVIVTGRFRTLEEVDQVIRLGQADLVGMTRATIADPDLVNKTIAGQVDRIRPCIACNQGCLGQLLGGGMGMGIGCAVNAAAGHEETMGDDKLQPAPEPKNILIVGGGPAGMEAARIAAKRGHKVTLTEAMPDLGGTLAFAGQAPTRQQFNDFIHWAQEEVYLAGVDVRLSTFVTERDIAAFAPDHVILATGAEPRMDGVQLSHPGEPIEGIDLEHVISSNQLFSKGNLEATNALVVDDTGHYEALAAAEYLVSQGIGVNLVTRHPILGEGVRPAHMVDPFLERMGNKPFEYHVATRVLKIDGQSATLQGVNGGRTRQVNADLVVFVSLNRPRDALAPALEAAKIPYTYIGDVKNPRFLVAAVKEGYEAGCAL